MHGVQGIAIQRALMDPAAPKLRPSLEGETIFHEDWWWDVVAEGRGRRLIVREGDRVAGFLPILESGRGAWTAIQTPPFTHLTGPAIDVGTGSPASRLQRRFRITRELLDGLPPAQRINIVTDCTVPDVLAFQACGFATRPHYTIRIDCRDLDAVWSGMRQKARRFIRKVETRYRPEVLTDPDEFAAAYLANLESRGRRAKRGFRLLPRLHAAVKERDAGEMLGIRDEAGALLAAVFLVWGHGSLYYLMTTRSPAATDYGLVMLLVWQAAQIAHRRGLTLDLDGIISASVFEFLSSFGGDTAARHVCTRERPLYGAAHDVLDRLGITQSSTFY